MRSPVGCDDAGQPDVMQKLSGTDLFNLESSTFYPKFA